MLMWNTYVTWFLIKMDKTYHFHISCLPFFLHCMYCTNILYIFAIIFACLCNIIININYLNRPLKVSSSSSVFHSAAAQLLKITIQIVRQQVLQTVKYTDMHIFRSSHWLFQPQCICKKSYFIFHIHSFMEISHCSFVVVVVVFL